FDGDGDEDLFMTHLVNETNTLYVNDGQGNFDDTTDRIGLGSGSKAFTGFGTAWFDPDNDGWLDLFVANGDVKIEEQRASRGPYAFDQPNQLFLNRDGRRFEVWQPADDPATALSEISRGVAFGDVDRDGDVDMLVTNNSGPVRLLLNDTEPRHAWLGLRLVGTESPRSADGARVRIEDDLGVVRWRRVHSDGSYLSASDREILVGLADATAVTDLRVLWPSGRREQFTVTGGVRQRVTLTEGTGAPWPTP
ncbi:MAG: CRTAC1 family protein, partial [Pseudomonadota bacterium]